MIAAVTLSKDGLVRFDDRVDRRAQPGREAQRSSRNFRGRRPGHLGRRGRSPRVGGARDRSRRNRGDLKFAIDVGAVQVNEALVVSRGLIFLYRREPLGPCRGGGRAGAHQECPQERGHRHRIGRVGPRRTNQEEERPPPPPPEPARLREKAALARAKTAATEPAPLAAPAPRLRVTLRVLP